MFEKEAEAYATVDLPDGYTKIDYQKKADWQKGAEYGYNKANEWHYTAEEGLPAEADKYYYIAYQSALGFTGYYCKLVEKTRPIVGVLESTITGYETIKMWECKDSDATAWLNERGRVYAWKSVPDLPEYREYR